MTKIITPKPCKHCGKPFTPKRVTGQYCSRLCAHNFWVSNHEARWRAYNREWREAHPDYWREYYSDGRGVEVQRRRHERHPLQRKARGAVSYALRSGKLSRPTRCQACGREERLEAHHWRGYEKEHWLDVQWLCHVDHLRAG